MANLAQAFGKAAQTFANVYVSERARQDEMKQEQRWKEFYGRLAEGQFNLQKEQAKREQDTFEYEKQRNEIKDQRELEMLQTYNAIAKENGYRDWNTFKSLSDIEQQRVFVNQAKLEENLTNLRMTEIQHSMAMQTQAAARAAADKKSKEFEVIMELTDKTGDPTLAQELYALDKKIKAGVGNDEDMKNYADMTKRAQELAVKRKVELEKLAGKGGSGGVTNSQVMDILDIASKTGKGKEAGQLVEMLKRGPDSWTPSDIETATGLYAAINPQSGLDMSEVADQINALTVAEKDVIERFGTETVGEDMKPYKVPPTEGVGLELYNKIGMSKNALLAQAFGGDPSSPGMPAAPVEPLGAYRSQTMADVAKSAGTEDVTAMTFYPKGNPAAATTVPKTSPNLASLLDGVNKGVLEVAKGDQHSAAASDMTMTERATGNDAGAVVAQILGGFVGQGFDNQLGVPEVPVFSEMGDAMDAARKRKYPSARRFSEQSSPAINDFMKWLRQE